MTGLLLLSACGSSKDVTENNLPEPAFKDGIPPTLTVVRIRESTKSAKPNGTVATGKSVRVDITASEALMKPLVTINGIEAEVTGKVNGWFAVRKMTEADPLDEMVSFLITYQDISGELGLPVDTTTDGSAVLYCGDDCPEPVDTLAGDWRLDGVGAAGVGPAEGDVSYWEANEDTVVARACWFDDVYRFGADGSFRQILGDETWLEPFQGVESEQCGTPVAPHDGSATGTWTYNEFEGTLTIAGRGLHLGLAKVANGGQLEAPGDAPDSIIYNMYVLDGDTMTVTIETMSGEWWLFRFVREPVSPLAGKWKLDGEGAAAVGPNADDLSWWTAGADALVDRACWFDDIYEFGADGSFRNVQGAESWIELFAGGPDGGACGAPVAPHDGSNPAIYEYDEEAGTLKVTGVGAYIGLPKVTNDGELSSPAAAPESVTYNVVGLDGDILTVNIDYANPGTWQFRLVRVSSSPMVGNWKLDGEGSAAVGPNADDLSWWTAGADALVDRACWFDDVYHFGDDGSFRNFQEDESWIELFAGGPDGGACGAPVAPHDGSNPASFHYDEDAGTLTLTGVGAYIGLPKVTNDGELGSPAEAPDSVTYDVVSFDGDVVTVKIDYADPGTWQFRLARVPDTAAMAGKWKLDGEGAAAVGPNADDLSWWTAGADALVDRACWFDDVYELGADGSFRNIQGDESWIELFAGGPDGGACGTPVAPHDGSNPAIFEYDADAGTLKVTGVGAYIGLPKVTNDGELSSPAVAPESVTYNVVGLDGDILTVNIDYATPGTWQFRLYRVSNSPLVGNWKLDGEGSAAVGPNADDLSWWTAGADALVDRACWFDDVYHFGADGSFQNFQEDESWIELFAGGPDGGACGAPVAPHDGSNPAIFEYDADAGTLKVTGVGAYIGLPKVTNDGELGSPAEAPDSVTYDVVSFDGNVVTVKIDYADPGTWQFRLAK